MSTLHPPMELPSAQEPTAPPPTRREEARVRGLVRNQVEMVMRDAPPSACGGPIPV